MDDIVSPIFKHSCHLLTFHAREASPDAQKILISLSIPLKALPGFRPEQCRNDVSVAWHLQSSGYYWRLQLSSLQLSSEAVLAARSQSKTVTTNFMWSKPAPRQRWCHHQHPHKALLLQEQYRFLTQAAPIATARYTTHRKATASNSTVALTGQRVTWQPQSRHLGNFVWKFAVRSTSIGTRGQIRI